MTGTAFQAGPHFQEIEIYKGSHNLYTIQKEEKNSSRMMVWRETIDGTITSEQYHVLFDTLICHPA